MFRSIRSPLLPLLLLFSLAGEAPYAWAQAAAPLDKAFAFADAKHDGVVTRAEFQASRAARFQALDRNHDGFLSREDAPCGLRILRRAPGRLDDLIQLFDADHDGRISLPEFIAGSRVLFDRSDLNRDGILTHAEATAAAAALRSSPVFVR